MFIFIHYAFLLYSTFSCLVQQFRKISLQPAPMYSKQAFCFSYISATFLPIHISSSVKRLRLSKHLPLRSVYVLSRTAFARSTIRPARSAMQPDPVERSSPVDSAPAESDSQYSRPPSRKKSVSLRPPRRSSRNHRAHEKILARKPTPFNNDLAAQIRNSGILAAIERGDIEPREEDDDDDGDGDNGECESPQNQSAQSEPHAMTDVSDDLDRNHSPHMDSRPAEPNGVHINHVPDFSSSPNDPSTDDRPLLPHPPEEAPSRQNGHASGN